MNNKKENIVKNNKINIKKNNSEKGLIQTILLIIVVILVVSYFNIDMKQLVESETTQNNFSFVGGILHKIWEILKPVVDMFWKIISPFVKESIKSQL